MAPTLAIAGVVDQDAHRAFGALDGRDSFLHRRLVGDIQLEQATARLLEVV